MVSYRLSEAGNTQARLFVVVVERPASSSELFPNCLKVMLFASCFTPQGQ